MSFIKEIDDAVSSITKLVGHGQVIIEDVGSGKARLANSLEMTISTCAKALS